MSLKESGFATDQNLKELNSTRKSLKLARTMLIHLVKEAESQKERRCEKRKAMLEVTSVSKEATSKLRKFTHGKAGRPPLEEKYPSIHQAIVDLVTVDAGADARRRTETHYACKTINDLHSSLTNPGYSLSRQALCLGLVPRSYDSAEGKRHVKTVPVRLPRAQNNKQSRHVDANFTFATRQQIMDMISSLVKNVFSSFQWTTKPKF